MYSSVPRNNASHGAEAIAEAIRNHQDRLSLNSTKSSFGHATPNPFQRAQTARITAGRSQMGGGAIGKFAHWALEGNRPGAGLAAVPGQLAQMFNPTKKAGLANIAGLFAGGPKGDEMGGYDMMGATRVMDKMGMKNQFGPYSMAANRAAGHLVEHDMQAPQFREGVQNAHFNRNAYKANDFLASKGNVGQGWNPMGPEAIAGFKGASLAQRQALYNMLFGPKNELFSNFPTPPRP